MNQDYNQDYNLFTEEGITGYIMQVSFSLPALSPTLLLSSLLTVSGNAFPNECEYFLALTASNKSVCCRNSEKWPHLGLLQDCLLSHWGKARCKQARERATEDIFLDFIGFSHPSWRIHPIQHIQEPRKQIRKIWSILQML